jgi:hypothetical protein
MYLRCWNCSESLDAFSVEIQIYEKLINDIRSRMCLNTVNDKCEMWWRHEDCLVLQDIIEELKEKLP